MYLEHFSLNERPFSISPDPRFLFMSNRYKEALTHLTYGIQEGGGFVLLTGEVGTGKTTVCRCLLQQLPENTRLAFVLNPKLNSRELLATICDELKIEYPENCDSLKILTDKLSEYLLECFQAGLSVVVMIDEAQNLEIDVLEQIRLLTNLETNQKKLLQIILVGQPELQEKLVKRELRQLAQRVTARYHLRPLNLRETLAYIVHRTRIAGSKHALFSRQAVEYLHAKTEGIPRLINTICDRALLAASTRKKARVDRNLMTQAVKEIMGESDSLPQHPLLQKEWIRPTAMAGIVVLVAMLAFWAGRSDNSNDELVSNANASSAGGTIPTTTNENQLEPVTQVSDSKGIIRLPEKPSLPQRLIGDQRWDNNGRLSFQKLFQLWSLEYEPLVNGEPCEYAAEFGLQCSRIKRGNWQVLRSYNRPALLKFSAGLQGDFWGLIKSIQGLEATVIFGEKESEVSLEELSSIWGRRI